MSTKLEQNRNICIHAADLELALDPVKKEIAADVVEELHEFLRSQAREKKLGVAQLVSVLGFTIDQIVGIGLYSAGRVITGRISDEDMNADFAELFYGVREAEGVRAAAEFNSAYPEERS